MNEVQPISISPEAIDKEVLEIVKNNPGIVKECVYYLLPHHDKALVYSSLKRLEKSELLGYTIAHSPTKENSTDESAEENHSPSYSPSYSPTKENKGLHIRWRPSAGTASGNHEYPYLYLDNSCIIYVAGGNRSNPVAIARCAELQRMIDRKVITADTPVSEIRWVVKGVQRRNQPEGATSTGVYTVEANVKGSRT